MVAAGSLLSRGRALVADEELTPPGRDGSPLRTPPRPGERPHFVRQVSAAAAALGISVEWHCDQWVAALRKAGTTAHIIGCSFPLNSSSSAQVASDKVAAYTVLSRSGVPAIPHYLFRFLGRDPGTWAGLVAAMVTLPVVIKPHMESGGIDVCRAAGPDELDRILAELARRYRAIAVSPYAEIECEYRAVVLDGDVKLLYRKVRPGPAEWRHNLRLGAVPETICDPGEVPDVLRLARVSMAALGLRFASVDVVHTAGGAMVLEVNSAVTLEHYSDHLPAHASAAAAVYRDALAACFDLGPAAGR